MSHLDIDSSALDEEISSIYQKQITGELENPMLWCFEGDDGILRTQSIPGIGLICFSANNRFGEAIYLRNFWLSPENRGKGYGSKIFTLFKAAWTADGESAIELESTKESVGFWLKMGFKKFRGNRYRLEL